MSLLLNIFFGMGIIVGACLMLAGLVLKVCTVVNEKDWSEGIAILIVAWTLMALLYFTAVG